MQKPKQLLYLAPILSFALFARATEQVPDVLIWGGKEYSIYTNPLEDLLENEPGKRPIPILNSSANRRGYIATWEIVGDRLRVKNVEVYTSFDEDTAELRRRSVIAELFPSENPTFAEWFTGHIIVPDGKLLHSAHMGYSSMHESFTVLRVEKGVLSRYWSLNAKSYREFRNAQFSAFKQTVGYQSAVTKSGGTEVSADDTLESFIFHYCAEEYMSKIFDEKQ